MISRITPDSLRCLVEQFLFSYPEREGVINIWRRPILATARADDRFSSLKKIAHSDHLMPWDLIPSARSVVVFFIPFSESLVNENAPGEFPCRSWGTAYVETNELIGLVTEHISDYLASKGYRSSITPATHNFDPVRLTSSWSHKHIAFLSGLGRFGHNAQIITPSGCAGRLGSLVTEADLGDSPAMDDLEACLHRAGKGCLECVKRCPVQGLTDVGIDRKRCFDRLRFNKEHLRAFSDLPETTHVCGKCVSGVPCSLKNPMVELHNSKERDFLQFQRIDQAI